MKTLAKLADMPNFAALKAAYKQAATEIRQAVEAMEPEHAMMYLNYVSEKLYKARRLAKATCDSKDISKALALTFQFVGYSGLLFSAIEAIQFEGDAQ